MSAFTPLLRQRLMAAAPRTARFASTVSPRAYRPPHMSLGERFQKFCPVEAYPLLVFVVAMSSFGITYGVKAFNAVPGELRLMPSRYYPQEQQQKKEVWEQD